MSIRYVRLLLMLVVVFIALPTVARAEIFFAYLSGAQENPPTATTATGYARIFLDEASGMITFTVVFNGLTTNAVAYHIHTGAIGVNGPVTIDFGSITGTTGSMTGTRPITPTQITSLRSNGMYVNVHSTMFGGGEIRGQLGKRRPIDFDGDGRNDYSVLKFPAAGTPRPIRYWNLNSTTGAQVSSEFGDALRDFPAPGDWDGDGLDDLALFRAGTAGVPQASFWILRSSDNAVQYYAWGITGDQNVARDYDGDGITDAAVTRRGAGSGDPLVWYIRRSATNTVDVVHWGLSGTTTTAFDAPVPGDYDGDGKFDIAVYRFNLGALSNNFLVKRSSDGGSTYQPWGNFTTDWIVPGDYDGDGKYDFCAVRTGASASIPMVWQILHAAGSQRYHTFGISSDVPAQGDYDGDARTDLAIVREGGAATQTNFWVFNSHSNSISVRQWGVGADFPTNIFDTR